MMMNLLFRGVVLAALGLGLSARADTPPAPPSALDLQKLLACPGSPNCVNSLGVGGLAPLAYKGSVADGMARLRATVATFSEAQIERADELSLTAIFTTRLGFRDEVIFVIDPATQLIHFRSRSLVGYYDFGKNRSRMEGVVSAFLRQQP